MVRRGRWGTFSWRSSTPSLGRAGSRRTTLPSLRYDVQRLEAELPSTRLLGTSVNKRRLTSKLPYQANQAGYVPVGILRVCLPHLWLVLSHRVHLLRPHDVWHRPSICLM